MNEAPTFAMRISSLLGRPDVPRRPLQERGRALNRAVVAAVLALLWIGQIHFIEREPVSRLILGATIAYGLTAAAYGYLLSIRPDTGPTLLYAFVIADPLALVGVLRDQETFALALLLSLIHI